MAQARHKGLDRRSVLMGVSGVSAGLLLGGAASPATCRLYPSDVAAQEDNVRFVVHLILYPISQCSPFL